MSTRRRDPDWYPVVVIGLAAFHLGLYIGAAANGGLS